MSKKIVFVGPPGVGKTTLRKIFFEFESAEHLLQFAINPTYGIESIVLNFGQDIGVFDLAGQENEKWFETEEKEVFLGTTNIIIVVDASDSVETILEFSRKVLDIRKELAPDSMIYLLVHKIDLVDSGELENKKSRIFEQLMDNFKIKIEFTSVKRSHILESITVFQNIVNATLEEEIPFEKLDYDLINDVLTFFSLFRSKTLFNEKTLTKICGFNRERFAEIVNILCNRQYLKIQEVNGEKVFKLTLEKKTDFINLLENFSREKFSKLEEKYRRLNIPEGVKVPPFIGFIIADNIGRTLLSVEQKKGDFIRYLGLDKDDE
ncbi:MAG: GTPase domain-containing protein, partial [Candidatus Hodarchaeota archaeon]